MASDYFGMIDYPEGKNLYVIKDTDNSPGFSYLTSKEYFKYKGILNWGEKKILKINLLVVNRPTFTYQYVIALNHPDRSIMMKTFILII